MRLEEYNEVNFVACIPNPCCGILSPSTTNPGLFCLFVCLFVYYNVYYNLFSLARLSHLKVGGIESPANKTTYIIMSPALP